MSEAAKSTENHGLDEEAMMAPITKELIEECQDLVGLTISLLLSPVGSHGKSGDKSFYAHSLMQFRTSFTNTVMGQPMLTAGVSITDKVNLYINPHFFLKLNLNQRIELFIHEIEHVLEFHMIRGKELMGHSGISQAETHKLYNIVTDASINIPLADLTADLGVTFDRINEALKKEGSNIQLSPEDASEINFYKLRQFQEEQDGQGKAVPMVGFGEGKEGATDDHGTWAESIDNEELAKAVIKDAMNKAAESTGIGNCPDSVVRALGELNKSLVNWKQQLAQFFVRTVKFERERTRTKRNRRTGLVNPGARKKPQVKLGFVGDESGSMGDDQVKQLHTEVCKLADLMGVEVYYIPMDSEVGEVVKMKKGMKLNRTRCGGTYYAPPLNKAKELDLDGVIFGGDFDCADKPEKPKFPVLWVGVNTKSPAPANFGKVIYIDTKK